MAVAAECRSRLLPREGAFWMSARVQSPVYHAANRLGFCKRRVGRQQAQENNIARTSWSRAHQVVQDGVPGILRQWQPDFPTAFAADPQSALFPSMSSRRMAETSLARSPSRPRRRRMARSRIPLGCVTSQDETRRSTSSAGRYRGRADSRQCFADGTARSSPTGQSPLAAR